MFSAVFISASMASIIVAIVPSIWLEEVASLRKYINKKKSTSGKSLVIPSNFPSSLVASLAFLIMLGLKSKPFLGGKRFGQKDLKPPAKLLVAG
jgi:hypothetical protein